MQCSVVSRVATSVVGTGVHTALTTLIHTQKFAEFDECAAE